MPYDNRAEAHTTDICLRDVILELLSRRTLDPAMSDQQYRAALRAAVVCSRRPAEHLWDQYHSCPADTRAATYAKYGY